MSTLPVLPPSGGWKLLWQRLGVYVGGPIAAIAASLTVADHVAQYLPRLFLGSAASTVSQFDTLATAVLLSVLTIAVYFSIAYFVSVGKKQKKAVDLSIYNRTIDDVKKFIESVYSQKMEDIRRTPTFKIISESETHEILEDYSGKGVNIVEIGGPAKFWTYKIYADDLSPEMNTFDDINLSVRIIGGKPRWSVVLMPFINRPKIKHFVILFDPPIEDNETRRLHIEFFWRGYWNELKERGEVTYATEMTDATKSTGSLTLTFNLHGEVARGVTAKVSAGNDDEINQGLTPRVNAVTTFSYTTHTRTHDGRPYGITLQRASR